MDYFLAHMSKLEAQAGGSSWSGHTLVDLTIKALLVIAVAACFAWLFRKAAASRRHAGWLAATVLLVTLPIASVALPKWALPLLPAESIEAVNRAATSIANSSLPPVAARAVAGWSANDASISSWWSRLTIAGWAFGAFLVLSRAAVGLVRLHRLRRSAGEFKDPKWQLNVARAKEQTGVSRDVCLLKSTQVRTPITWGLRRVYICFPMHADQWDTNSRQVVLNHELTHARRGDWLWHWLTIAMTAVHWFNPLAWWAAHRLRTEAEIACDDAVIGRGCAPSEYADCLYQMVRAAKATPLHANTAMPMARPSELPTRLARILNDRTSRHETSFRTLLLTLVVAVMLGSVIAAAQVVRARVQVKPSAESASEEGVAKTHDAVTGWNREDSKLTDNARNVRNATRTWFLQNGSSEADLERFERALAEKSIGRQQVGETMGIILRNFSMNVGGEFEVHPAIVAHMKDDMRLTDDQMRLVQGIAQRIADGK